MQPNRDNTYKEEKIASIILSFLEKNNVLYIFGMHGGYTTGFSDETHDHPKINFILCSHEEGAAFMADGFAKTSKKFGAPCINQYPNRHCILLYRWLPDITCLRRRAKKYKRYRSGSRYIRLSN
ncbi:MAG: hypothetical protein JRJ49_05800 [Deltaproteobacteria bacterium]|nr:hypothetical protein [Deltaproteobacteria bacterium]